MIPPTCYNCGKALGEFEERIATEKLQQGNDLAKTLDKLGIKKICCRIQILTNINECVINKNSS